MFDLQTINQLGGNTDAESERQKQAAASYSVGSECTNAKNDRENGILSSVLGLLWVKTTSLSGHHSRFGTSTHAIPTIAWFRGIL